MTHRTLGSVAFFNGLQETTDKAPWFGQPVPLWTLTAPVRGLLAGSTYAERTLRNALLAEEADAAWARERLTALIVAFTAQDLPNALCAALDCLPEAQMPALLSELRMLAS